ncbi:MAG: SPOR domain-containing protein [Hyphomicrobiaceae bacterium]
MQWPAQTNSRPPQWPAEPPPAYHYPRGQHSEAGAPPTLDEFPALPGGADLRGASYDQHALQAAPIPASQTPGRVWPEAWRTEPPTGRPAHAPVPPHGPPSAFHGYAPVAPPTPEAYAPADPPQYVPQAPAYPHGYASEQPEPRWAEGSGYPQAPVYADADPRGYDLAQYGFGQAGEAAQHSHGHAGHPDQHHPGWDQPQQYAPGYGDQQYQHAAEEPYPDDEVEEEPAPRRGGTLLVVAALVGAIVAGGGMAYAYKAFFAGDGKRGTPVVRADSRPAKTAPGERGGREFQNTNSKLLSRLDSQSAGRSGAEASGNGRVSEDGRVRVVPTVVVGRDGSVVSQPPAAQPPVMQASPVPGATVVVPGTSLSGGYGGGAPAYPPQQRAYTPPQQPAPAAPPAPLNRASAPSADATSEPAAARVAAPRYRGPPLPERPAGAGGVQREEPAPVAEPRRVAAVAPRSAPPAVAPAGAGVSGYVAVLSSSRSQIDALKAFADLQQKYPTVLQSRTPEVREADLSARGLGKMYRAVVGPPGSRQAAAGVCSQLKSAGYTGCWVSAY